MSAKSRPKKPEQVVAALRKLQKDTTRRRFFRECCKPDSVLWAPPVSGSKAETLRAELFDKAAEDPLNLIFAENPGATRNVTGVQLRKIIRWQVAKDRANYKHKPPKRWPQYGDELEFDFTAELVQMRLDTTVALIPKEYHVTAPSPPPSPNINTIPPSPPPSPNINTIPMLDVDLLKACCTCGLVVWIGPAGEIPEHYTRACPENTDWSDVNADPYCHGCWAKESEFLRGLANQHKAIGGRKQENQGQQKTQEKAGKKTKKAAPKKKKKINANKKKTVSYTHLTLPTTPYV